MNNSKRTILFHVGFPKAGSTTLQKHIFPKSQKLRYLGKDSGFGHADNHLFPIFNFIGGLAFETEDSIENTYNSFHKFILEEEIRRYGENVEEIPLLISFETFTSLIIKPINHGFGMWGADPDMIFRRLKVFGDIYKYDINILLIERNFKSFVHSWYTQDFSKFRKVNSLKTIKLYLKGELEKEYLNLGLKWFLPGKIEEVLSKYFLENNILVLQFEELVKDSNSESRKKLEKILDLDLSNSFTVNENKREATAHIKIADIRKTTDKKLSFFKSLHKGIEEFKYHFLPAKFQKVEILWDDECDDLLDQIKKKHKKL